MESTWKREIGAACIGSLRNGARAALRAIPLLGDEVDQLAELRALIRRAQEEERRLTQEILTGLQAAGLSRLAGRQAVAIVEQRATLRPDPELFYEALGARAFEALTVSVTPARRLMAPADLEAISDKLVSPVLRVERVSGE